MIHGRRWAKIHEGRSWGIWSPLLAVFSWAYGTGVRTRMAAYERGLLGRRSLPAYVVSVGNLTAGGTGKTPMVLALAEWGAAQGHRVAVLSRGYGGERTKRVLVVSEGSGPLASARECGDEPYLLASRLSGVPVIVSADRYAAGKTAIERYGARFLILDDGFQHLRLERDLDIALLDGSRPFGNGRLLPFGPLREPLEALARADLFVLTRCAEAADPAEGRAPKIPPVLPSRKGVDAVVPPLGGRDDRFAPLGLGRDDRFAPLWVKGGRGGFVSERPFESIGESELPKGWAGALRQRFPETPVFMTGHAPDRVVYPTGETDADASTMKGMRVVAFAGIARPETFLGMLKGLGVEVLHFTAFGDHHPYSRSEIAALEARRRALGGRCLLTTEKDWARVLSVASPGPDFGFVSIRLRFLSDEAGFFRRVEDGLERKRAALTGDL